MNNFTLSLSQPERKALAVKCKWLVEVILRTEGGARTPKEISNSTGIDQGIIDDCICHLMKDGSIKIHPTSKLEWVVVDVQLKQTKQINYPNLNPKDGWCQQCGLIDSGHNACRCD